MVSVQRLKTSKTQIRRIAAVHFDNGVAVDHILEDVVRALQAAGANIAGCLQREVPVDGNCCNDLLLENIGSGCRYGISQPLGSGSKGCRLDPQGLAEVTGSLLAELDQRPDFVFLNRFGKGESEGQGLRVVIEAALKMDIPVVIAVRPTYADAWLEFVGELSDDLAADQEDLITWCENHYARRTEATAA